MAFRYDLSMTLGSEQLQIGLDHLGAGAWTVPGEVTTDGRTLEWEGAGKGVSAPSDLVDRFVCLRDATAAEIGSFALEWGPLFNRPDDRGHARCPACDLAAGRGRATRHELATHGCEPVSAWRRLASDVMGVLQVAAAYHKDETVSDETLGLFRNVVVENRLPDNPDFVGAQLPMNIEALFSDRVLPLNPHTGPTAEMIGAFVNVLLEPVGIRSYMSADGLPTTRLEPFGLIGALGLQLMQKISTTTGVANCSGCGASFSPTRKPRAGQRTYCPRCRDSKVPQRDAARASRGRRR